MATKKPTTPKRTTTPVKPENRESKSPTVEPKPQVNGDTPKKIKTVGRKLTTEAPTTSGTTPAKRKPKAVTSNAPVPSPNPNPRPAVAQSTMEAEAIKSTSQLKARLGSLGIKAVLAEPPKVFVAVLSTPSGKTTSEIFTVQSHGESSCHEVIARLASGLLGSKVSKAQHDPCGIEFFLKREFEVLGKESTVILGENVSYLVPGTRRRETLGEGIQIQIFRNNPHILDTDAATLRTNKMIAAEAVAAKQAENGSTAEILKLASETQKGEAELLRDLEVDL